eukprot:CAMPEP_0172685938 /NCGR_PEP_ID=MMETSP1074-20121228/20585_1 /TAXON_ID=2916 /ORGANISM="Ceratium fusus, Strain PA161109" /LENGTH=343 /DNA_ID=CAMNT_0013505169 /DNA_START=78 /DNA_END=1109 /DNA_ORIENTATION=-
MVGELSQVLPATPTTRDGRSPMALPIRLKYLRNLGFRRDCMTHSPSTWLVPQQPTATLALNVSAQTDMKAESEPEEKEEVLSTDAGSCESSPSTPSTDEIGSDSDTVEGQTDTPTNNRNHKDFRANFLNKLSYSGVWLPAARRPLRSQAILIFDWDDTLVCTSFLEQYEGVPLPQAVMRRMSRVAGAVKKVLEMACRLGQVFIITNAKEGWVEHSAALWIPEVIPLLKQITVISARSTYEACFPTEITQWKRQAFLALQCQMDQHALTNLIAVGDSVFEMDAAQAMGDRFARAVVKTVKLRPRPSPQELLAELGLVLKQLERIMEAGHPLQIQIDRLRKGPSS